jgi:hypothetical protein
VSEVLPPNHNNGEPLEDLSFASSGAFQHYRFGTITPGFIEDLSFASSGAFQHYRFGTITPGFTEELLIFGKLVDVPEKPVYYQRVYDATLGWCYYRTEGNPNPDPPTTATSPFHTGNISDAQVLNVVGIPER